MPNVITPQVILDGSKNTIVKYTITGDGSGDETKTVLYDASTFFAKATDNSLLEIESCLKGFSAQLFWDATTDVPLLSLLQDSEVISCFRSKGGLHNNAGTGKTGDILISTDGLGATDHGHIILTLRQED